MAVVAKPPPSQHVTNVESRCGSSQSDSKDWPCGIQDQIWAFNAATGNALTTVLAGLGFWFPASLDPGKARDGEDAGLLHLSGANLSQVTQELGDNTLLQFGAGCE